MEIVHHVIPDLMSIRANASGNSELQQTSTVTSSMQMETVLNVHLDTISKMEYVLKFQINALILILLMEFVKAASQDSS